MPPARPAAAEERRAPSPDGGAMRPGPLRRLAAALRRLLAPRAPGNGRAAAPGAGEPPANAAAALPPAPAVAAAARPPAAALAVRARILLVEDDALVARAIARVMERLGHEVDTCADGAEALALFRGDPTRFDLVLTDETLPGLRGDRLAAALLALRPDLPVLICTGYSDRLDDDGARALGIRALLLKPIDVPQLEDALRTALARPEQPPG